VVSILLGLTVSFSLILVSDETFGIVIQMRRISKTGILLLTSRHWHVFGETAKRKNVSLANCSLPKLQNCQGFVYRFITTGTIEEKIFQRQSNKQALSSAVVDEKEDVERHFSLDALRQLFQFNETTLCETHETFKCKRCKDGRQVTKAPALLYGDASTSVYIHSIP
jgi:hypothetical protein